MKFWQIVFYWFLKMTSREKCLLYYLCFKTSTLISHHCFCESQHDNIGTITV